MGNIAMQGASGGQGRQARQAREEAAGKRLRQVPRAGEQSSFESIKPALVRSYPGRFAVVCGPRLLGVYDSVDDAFLASSRAFDGGALPEGAPLLITELAEDRPCASWPVPTVRPRGRESPVARPPHHGVSAGSSPSRG